MSGITQGDGSHLTGETITINSSNWTGVVIDDNDDFFADNDGNQRTDTAVTYDGETYAANTRIEAEYTLVLEDPSGNTYTVYGINFVEGGGPSYGTVEGLAFLGVFPPVGVALTVVSASEGPSNSTNEYTEYYAPPCFVSDTRISTPDGDRLVQTLKRGDLVETRDKGARPLIWVGHAFFPAEALFKDPEHCPVELENGLLVSPQHRVLVSGWRAELVCAESEVLVTAKHLAEAGRAKKLSPNDFRPNGVTYWHIMFDAHEIVISNGIPTESFRPGKEALMSLPDTAAELYKIFPELREEQSAFSSARYLADPHETRAMMSAGAATPL